MSDDLVLVTGVSGFLASHVADQLLKEGYRVRGTVRSLKNEAKVKPIRDLGANTKYPLELVEADLTDENCWKDIVKDCAYVMHVASPLPMEKPNHEDEILVPAINGTLNVLNACLSTSVKRVVVTSSSLAATGAAMLNDKVYTEADWGDVELANVWTYCKSKILSEKAAWNFIEEKKKNNEATFDLAVVNPSLIFGPTLLDAAGVSLSMFLAIFDEKSEKLPNVNYPICDVRDVAMAHLRAAFIPGAAGRRHFIVSDRNSISAQVYAEISRKNFPKFKIPTEVADGESHGKTSQMDDSNMRNILKITPTDFEKTVVDTVNSLIDRGILKY